MPTKSRSATFARSCFSTFAAFAFASSFVGTAAHAQEIAIEGPVPTTATVRVESKEHTPLNTALLQLEVNGHPTPITSVAPIQPSQAQLAILIDGGLRSSFALQEKDLAAFVQSLPAGMQVMIGWMENGTVFAQTGFTTDRSASLAELHIPAGPAGVSASPYFCLSDFVKRWPSRAAGPRFVLMFTNGVDPYNGSTRLSNQDSPYVQTAQDDAQRAGVAVYSIYYTERAERGFGVGVSGQSYLQQVGEATGGESLYTGTFTPVNLQPFFDAFRRDLTETYTLQFLASTNREKNNTLDRIKVKSTQAGIKVHAPDGVHPGENVGGSE